MNIKNVTKKILNSAKKHSPEILTAMGIAGGITTVVLAVRATPKALDIIEEAESKKMSEGDEDYILTKVDVVKAVWKEYIPAAVTGVASIACIIGAQSVNAGRNAAIATAYKITETAFADYKDAVIEQFGEKKEEAVREKVAEKQLKRNPVEDREVIINSNSDVLMFDSISSRYFTSNIEDIKAAVNRMNAELISQDYISLNEFYYEIGISPTAVGDDIGWNSMYGLIEINYTARIATDGRPCIVLNYGPAPRYDFSKLM